VHRQRLDPLRRRPRAGIDRVIARTRQEQADFVAYAERANISVMGLTALNREFPCPQGDEAGAGPPGAGEKAR
jgi:hypothetical protein